MVKWPDLYQSVKSWSTLFLAYDRPIGGSGRVNTLKAMDVPSTVIVRVSPPFFCGTFVLTGEASVEAGVLKDNDGAQELWSCLSGASEAGLMSAA